MRHGFYLAHDSTLHGDRDLALYAHRLYVRLYAALYAGLRPSRFDGVSLWIPPAGRLEARVVLADLFNPNAFLILGPNLNPDIPPIRMNNFKIGLGSIVAHKIHGFTGVIVSRSEHLHACVIYGVQPPTLKKDGAPSDPLGFDEDSLEVISAYPNNEPVFDFELGSGVAHKTTPFEGSISIRTEFFHRRPTTRYAVQAPTLHEGKPTSAVYFDADELELLQAAEAVPLRKTGSEGEHSVPSSIGR